MSRRRNKNNRNYKVDSKSNHRSEVSERSSQDVTETPETSTSENSGSVTGDITKQRAMNDPSWYLKFPELAFSAGNVPFNEHLGGKVTYATKRISGMNSQGKLFEFDPENVKSHAIPGLCSLKTKPTFGLNVDMNDALNVAAQQFYANVRYVNSGRKNYDPADLTIAMLAIAEAYSYIMWCERLYGYAYMYSMRNEYINAALISANHVDPEDIRLNLANFRYWINTFISRVSAFAVPSDINIFRRRAFMYAHLYTESTTQNIKDQLYQFVPDGFYKFQLDATKKGSLKYKRLTEYETTDDILHFNDVITIGQDMLANIAGDEDFGLITGDIIKAYGSNILKLEPCPEALVIVPEYEEYTLSQMRNANIVYGLKRGSSSNNVYLTDYPDETFQSGDVMQANNGNLITVELVDDEPTVFTTVLSAGIPGIITVTNPNPDISDVFEATRLKTCFDQMDSRIGQNTDGYALTCGSDVVTEVLCSQYRTNEHGVYELEEEGLYTSVEKISQDGLPYGEHFVHFHWAPTLYGIDYTTENVEPPDVAIKVTHLDVISNVDNYTFLSYENVESLHKVALLSLMSVPGVAQIIS